jgi:dolichyl-diphosphooligosaccharide--protein glycosyltransferase/undecaprenyl-diphosphooligosaccharide--protein glycosyltransferase
MINKSINKTLILILIAFAFSFVVRLIWVDQFSANESFKFNNEFMINTNDGYYYAEGARDIISGITQDNDLSPTEHATSIVTAIFSYILPLSFESVILYMPAFLSSLLVIPLVLIGKSFGKEDIGFIAALLGSITWSYYNRTMVGYYDTDMLNIVFPAFLLWSLIWAIRTREDKYILFTGLEIVAYRWWYPQSYSLEFAFFALLALYVIYLYIKKKEFHFELKLIIVVLFAMVNLPDFVRLIGVVGLYFGFKQKSFDEYILKIFIGVFLIFIFTGGLNPIIGKLQSYVFLSSTDEVRGLLEISFYSVKQTIREAGSIPFETFANRISGHTISFILAIIGYIWMVVRHKEMLLALPMIGLGFLAYGIPGLVPPAGLRFTVYAVPIMALGLAFLIVESTRFMVKQYLKDKAKKIAYYGVLILATAAVLYPNIKHVYDYKVPTVFTNKEVVILDKLKSIADREDYVVTWWDYGYPIRYYSDVKTLVDGGKHSGAVNFPVSFVLNEPQEVAAKMARLDVEYTEKRFAINENNKDLDINHTNYIKWESSNIAQMSVDYGYKDVNNFLIALETDIKLPKKTRDVYIYLPNRMMGIFPTVNLFSNLDLMTGQKYPQPFFYNSNRFKQNAQGLDLGRGVQFYSKTGEIQIGNQKIKLNSFITTAYDNKGKLKVNKQTMNRNSSYYVIYMRSYNQFLVLDKKMYDSLYIQLFVLENYDKNLFEPVIMDPLSKIYRLKI